MPIFKKLLPLTLLICVSCKDPPLVDPCLLKIQVKNVTLSDGSILKIIDLVNSKGFCTPVDSKKAAYALGIDQLNKFTAYSNLDNSTLNQWIINNMK